MCKYTKNDILRKVNLKFWVSSRFGILGVGVWCGGWIMRYIDVKIEFFRKFLKKFSENFAKIYGKYVVIRKREIDIARWEINILMNGLRENNPEIIPNTSVKYLRNVIFHVFRYLFPTPFIYYSSSIDIVLLSTITVQASVLIELLPVL